MRSIGNFVCHAGVDEKAAGGTQDEALLRACRRGGIANTYERSELVICDRVLSWAQYPVFSRRPSMETWSEKITRAIGSPTSLLVHTALFLGTLVLPFFGVSLDRVLLVLTTIVSLEAIYLALFIQMTVNRHSDSLEDIEEDIDEIEEDLDEIQEEDKEDEVHDHHVDAALGDIQKNLLRIMEEIETLKKK